MRKTAMIYIKEGNREIDQKLICQIHALENGYDVVDIAKSFDEVDNCDVMLVTNRASVSKDEVGYHVIANDLKERGIEIEIVITKENVGRYLDLITSGFKKVKAK